MTHRYKIHDNLHKYESKRFNYTAKTHGHSVESSAKIAYIVYIHTQMSTHSLTDHQT